MLFESSILKDYFFLIYFGLLLQLNTQFPIWNGVGVEYAIWEVEGLIKKKNTVSPLKCQHQQRLLWHFLKERDVMIKCFNNFEYYNH